jgi:hypothetical protein
MALIEKPLTTINAGIVKRSGGGNLDMMASSI